MMQMLFADGSPIAMPAPATSEGVQALVERPAVPGASLWGPRLPGAERPAQSATAFGVRIDYGDLTRRWRLFGQPCAAGSRQPAGAQRRPGRSPDPLLRLSSES